MGVKVHRVQKVQRVQRVVVSPSAMSMKTALRDLPPPSMGEGDRVSGGGGWLQCIHSPAGLVIRGRSAEQKESPFMCRLRTNFG